MALKGSMRDSSQSLSLLDSTGWGRLMPTSYTGKAVDDTTAMQVSVVWACVKILSLMDYPAPWVRVGGNGDLDLSLAYGVGVGVWDLAAIRWAYAEIAPGLDEPSELAAIVADALRQNYIFLTDEDARPAGAANPRASLWDNGDDPVNAFETTLRVRRIALARFGERNVAPGQPLALLDETLTPIYLWHRFQLLAVAKLLGGVDYRYALRGDGQPSTARPVRADRQRRALSALLETLHPTFLDLPEELLRRLLPRPAGLGPNAEQLAIVTSLANPEPSPGLIDRCLVAAYDAGGIEPGIRLKFAY